MMVTPRRAASAVLTARSAAVQDQVLRAVWMEAQGRVMVTWLTLIALAPAVIWLSLVWSSDSASGMAAEIRA